MSDQLSILVTGAGAPGIRGTVYALRKNPESRPVRLIGVDAEADVVGRFFVDKFYRVPPPEDPSYLDELRKICRAESVAIVVPQTTREIARLSHCREVLEREHIRVMVSGREAIEIANNKWSLLLKFKELGLPYPVFEIARTEEELVKVAHGLGYPNRPVVVKPPVSNGMRGVRVLRIDGWDVKRFLSEKPSGLEISLEDLLKILRRGETWPELVVTEYLPGPEYTVDVFVGKNASLALPRLRKSIRSGITFRSESEYREDMSRYSLEVARHIGLQYAFGFQFKLDENSVPKILECNPRIQGTMVASGFTGANVIWLAAKELLGETINHLDPPSAPASFYRFWGGVGICGDYVDEI